MSLVDDVGYLKRSLLFRFVFTVLLVFAATLSSADEFPSQRVPSLPYLSYTNYRIATVPWSIHVVRLQRNNSVYAIDSVHAGGKAISLETLSEQLESLRIAQRAPAAGINGDFYQRDKAFAGAPRGLQIMNGELISAPCGAPTFWIDAVGQFHATNVGSLFRITWPGGASSRFGLNGERKPDGIQLYTPAIGTSTHTAEGRELVLSRAEGSRWLPLRIGQNYTARVVEIKEGGDTRLTAETMVLSVGPGVMGRMPAIKPGMVIGISTEAQPALHGVRMAVGGGPVLLREGKPQKFRASPSDVYEFSSMLERHPRTAIGWDRTYFYMVEVDGRQKGLSVGMTLDELTSFLTKLGCEHAMNLDGGGSATLWYAGQVQNSPCDRAEREIANGIAIVRQRPESGTVGAHK